MMTVECRCGAVFIALGKERTCPDCAAEREALTCDACGTRLLTPAPLCGLCIPSTYDRALAAMAAGMNFLELWRELRADYPERATKRPCKGCGEPIQPGQIYAVRGPWHIRCFPRPPR